MKVAVVTDSNSGIVQEEAERLGIYVIPMPFLINGREYEEEINLTQEQFYTMLEGDADISTSQPSLEKVMTTWETLLEEYDEIVHIPMSSGLSGSCQSAMMLAEEYDGRVQVVDNHRISVTLMRSVLDALELSKAGFTAAQIKEILERMQEESSIYITVDTLKYLKKGGRLTPAVAALGTLLRIKPVLQIRGEKLDSFSKARTVKQGKATMVAAIARDLEEMLHDAEAEHCWIDVAHTCSEEVAKELAEEMQALYPKVSDIRIAPLPLSISCHIGQGSFAVTCTKKLDLEEEKKHYGA